MNDFPLHPMCLVQLAPVDLNQYLVKSTNCTAPQCVILSFPCYLISLRSNKNFQVWLKNTRNEFRSDKLPFPLTGESHAVNTIDS